MHGPPVPWATVTDAPTEHFQTLTGMRDVLFPESSRRRELVSLFARVVERAGYRELRPPLLEDLGVFLRVGEGTDVVTKEMYDFPDKDGRRIALRPESTAVGGPGLRPAPPADCPGRSGTPAPNFRHERPQAGRYRQHSPARGRGHRLDDPDLDVEVIALAVGLLRASSGCARSTLVLNSLGDADDRRRYTEAVRDLLRRARSASSPRGRAEKLDRNPLRVLDSKRPDDQAAIADAPASPTTCPTRRAAHFERVQAGLDAAGHPLTESSPGWCGASTTTRHTTFEFAAEALDAAQNAIGGGGRYDGLVEDLGGPPTAGIGFGSGIERILLACDAEGVFPAPEPALDVFVVDADRRRRRPAT